MQTKRMSRAAIYARISSDPSNERAGVDRQIKDCHALAARLGLVVVDTYIDNNISAASGKDRPAYRHMLEAIKSGQIDTVIAWNIDRLYRRMRELEDYIDLSERFGIRTETCVAGSFDINTPMGKAMVRSAITFASLEVDQSALRVKTAKLHQAKQGKFSGGQRPFGYEADGITLRPSEVATLRDMAGMVTDGASFRQVGLLLNERGVTTGHGYQWNALKVRNVLVNKRYIGVRVHNGDAEYQAEWPAIFTPDEWDNLQAAIVLHRAQYKQRGSFRKNLLTGFIYCGNCGAKMLCGTKQYRDGHSEPIWRCVKRRDIGHDGCGKVLRNMAPIDDLVAESIIYRINSREMIDELARQSSNDDIANIIRQERAQEALLVELLEDRASGLLNRQEYASAKVTAEEKLQAIRTKMAALTATGDAHKLPEALTREQWDAASLTWRRSILNAMIERVTVMPVVKRDMRKRYKQWIFEPELVTIGWVV